MYDGEKNKEREDMVGIERRIHAHLARTLNIAEQ
jgi:hypothetical protein